MKNAKACPFLLIMITGLWPGLSWAQDRTKDSLSVSSKIDSIFTLQKKMYHETRNAPLANKKFGIEFNFARLLLIKKAVSLSGGFSLFSVDRHAEIAFPIYFSRPEDPKDLRELTIDCHYRYFLGNTQNGFYLSGFLRYAHLVGYRGGNNLNLPLWDIPSDGERSNENKIGIGVGIGYRQFSYKGPYWGISFSVGRFLIGKNNRFVGGSLSYDDDNKIIVDFEILKFGWAF